MAMVIVTLVATMAASMVWQQWRAVQVEGSERTRSQSYWVLSGALDWARLILREDKRSGPTDNLGEPWAVELAEARISSFLATDKDNNSDDAPEAFLSGKVEDATSRYNLNNLISADGDPIPEEVAILAHICEYAGLPPNLATGIAQALSQGRLAVLGEDPLVLTKLGGPDGRKRAPLIPQSIDQLTWLGLDPGTVERLRPYVTFLPGSATTVNMNTASKEVIAAVAPKLDLALAGRLVQIRQRSPFKDPEEAKAELGNPNLDLGTRLAVTSDFFEVRGRLRYEDSIIEQRHLLQRMGVDDVVVRHQARFSGLEPANPGVPPP